MSDFKWRNIPADRSWNTTPGFKPDNMMHPTIRASVDSIFNSVASTVPRCLDATEQTARYAAALKTVMERLGRTKRVFDDAFSLANELRKIPAFHVKIISPAFSRPTDPRLHHWKSHRTASMRRRLVTVRLNYVLDYYESQEELARGREPKTVLHMPSAVDEDAWLGDNLRAANKFIPTHILGNCMVFDDGVTKLNYRNNTMEFKNAVIHYAYVSMAGTLVLHCRVPEYAILNTNTIALTVPTGYVARFGITNKWNLEYLGSESTLFTAPISSGNTSALQYFR